MENFKVTQLNSGEVYVSIYIEGKRKRIYNGKRYGINISPNKHPQNNRIEIAKILAHELSKRDNKLSPNKPFSDVESFKSNNDRAYLDKALTTKLHSVNSKNHKRLLKFTHGIIIKSIKSDKVCVEEINKSLSKYINATSHNTIRSYILNLCKEASKHGMKPIKNYLIPRKKQVEVLHKPFKDVKLVLEDLKRFNENLYLCCLLTYGCLLRPHREVRKLRWGNFNDDLSQIFLSGAENKTGRNRIVPVPGYIRKELKKSNDNLNIFSKSKSAYNDDYFKTLWGKYKRKSKILEKHQTLYSFRHSGAIEIYTRMASIDKLKVAMGHSSLKSTLTYLRGLEVSKLGEEDMPFL